MNIGRPDVWHTFAAVTPAVTAPHRRRVAPQILVVDDAPDVRQIHTALLYGSGMEVFTAENGIAALAVARRTVPDVVVTDVDMPIMDGLELCRQLRSDAVTRDLVVVMVTGDASELRRAALAAGCDAVLEKPCSRRVLLATIRVLLDRR